MKKAFKYTQRVLREDYLVHKNAGKQQEYVSMRTQRQMHLSDQVSEAQREINQIKEDINYEEVNFKEVQSHWEQDLYDSDWCNDEIDQDLFFDKQKKDMEEKKAALKRKQTGLGKESKWAIVRKHFLTANMVNKFIGKKLKINNLFD